MSRWLLSQQEGQAEVFDCGENVAHWVKETLRAAQRNSHAPLVVGCLGGCFRLIRKGHIEFIQHARAYVDVMLVLMVSKEANWCLKPGPCLPDADRVSIMRGIAGVDAVYLTHIHQQLEQMNELWCRLSIQLKDDLSPNELRLVCIKDGPRAGHTRLTTRYDTLFIPRPVVGDESSATDIFAEFADDLAASAGASHAE